MKIIHSLLYITLGFILTSILTRSIVGLGLPIDTPKNWSGVCSIWKMETLVVSSTPCRVIEVGGKDYWNRWFVQLEGIYSSIVQPRTADWIKAGENEVSEYYDSLLWGRMVIYPTSSTLRKVHRGIGYETRAQNITVVISRDNRHTEIWFDEPKNETDGRATPSGEWMERFLQDMITWGGARLNLRSLLYSIK